MRIRRGRPGDEVAIGEIVVAAWRWAYGHIIDPAYLAALDPDDRARRWVDTLRSPPERSAVLILEVGDEVIGFAAIAPSDEEPNLGELWAINLRPEMARQGFGTTVLTACEEQLRSFGFSDVVLWVLPDNTRARRFYEARGWRDEHVARRSDVGGIELDQVRYRRNLGAPGGGHTSTDDERRPGAGRYAHLEREQRWLLREVPSAAVRRCELVDRYIRGTRLRLRRVTTDDAVVVKLAQKIRVTDADPERVMLTNLYLSADEHAALAALPADVITKTRWAATWAGTELAIDEFHGQLSGLVLAETELGPDDQLLGLPDFAVRDVTHDDRFSGGALATMGAAEIGTLLAPAVGVP